MKIDELKSELKEKEKGCEEYIIGKNNYGVPDGCNFKCGKYSPYFDGKGLQYCPTCQAKIEYLKKGINACEEALSQRNQEILEKLTFEIKRQSAHRVINGNASEHDKRLFIHAEEIGREMERELVLRIIKQQLTTKEEGKDERT